MYNQRFPKYSTHNDESVIFVGGIFKHSSPYFMFFSNDLLENQFILYFDFCQ